MQDPAINSVTKPTSAATTAEEVTGLVFDIQRYSVHDGPGIRTTVFLKGCPLRCTWCHNPESQLPGPEMAVTEERCMECGECHLVCPTGAAEETNEGAACTLCGACVTACPTEARRIVGAPFGASELLAELLKDRVFYEDSGGGVTFSGGEPLSQPTFLLESLKKCRGEGLHTAVDTCGYAPTETVLEIAPFTDLFLFDIKCIDDTVHKQHTGLSNVLILNNLKALAQVHSAIWIRMPLIRGINDSASECEHVAELAASLPAIQQVNLLPYHRTGTQKLRRLGRSDTSPDLHPPGQSTLLALQKPFQERGIKVRIGG